MDRIVRKNKLRQTVEYLVYTKEEADELGLVYKPWREAPPGSWALTDDGYVGQCLTVSLFKDRRTGAQRAIKSFSFAKVWLTKYAKLEYLRRKATRSFSATSPQTWQQLEARRNRTKNTVDAYVGYVLASQPIDWKALAQLYRPDQKVPEATVKRLFREEEIRGMVREGIAKEAARQGLNEEWVLAIYKKAVEVAESLGDPGSMIRAAKEVSELLDLAPDKGRGGQEWLTAGVDAETSRALDEAQRELKKPAVEEATFKEIDNGEDAEHKT